MHTASNRTWTCNSVCNMNCAMKARAERSACWRP